MKAEPAGFDPRAAAPFLADPRAAHSLNAARKWYGLGVRAYHGARGKEPKLFETAYQFLLASTRIFEAQGLDYELGKALRMLTITAGTMSRFDEAEAFARRAAAHLRRVVAQEDAAAWLMKAYRDLAEGALEPEERLEAALEGLANLAKLDWDKNDSERERYEALFYRAAGGALTRSRPKTAEKLKRAVSHYEKAAAILSRPPHTDSKGARMSLAKVKRELARSLRALAALGGGEASLKAAEKAVNDAIAALEHDPPQSCWNLYQLGKIRMDQGRKKEALDLCLRAADLAEKDREVFEQDETRLFYWADKVAVFDYAIYAALETGDLEGAFDLAQRCKAKVFLERMARNGAAPARESAKALQARLAADEALVEYHCGAHALTLFALTKDGMVVRRIDTGRGELEALIEAVQGFMSRCSVDAASERFCRETLRELGAVLIDPIWKALENRARVTVVPSGPLFHLPWPALVLPDGAWAVDRWEISSTPHAARAYSANGGPPTARVVVLADSRGDLPHAAQEALELQSIYPDARVSLGQAVNRRLLQDINEPTLLHIACHGRLDPVDPKASYIDLGADGRLTVEDIAALDLSRVPLAFLSCCQTGLGKIWRGDELEGLSRAFLTAGAGRVVVSLWEIGDAATGELVKRYYRRLAAGAVPGEALREAQVEVKAEQGYAHPFYWAGLMKVG